MKNNWIRFEKELPPLHLRVIVGYFPPTVGAPEAEFGCKIITTAIFREYNGKRIMSIKYVKGVNYDTKPNKWKYII